MDPLLKLARVPRRPQPADLLIAGALLVWALLEAFLFRGPGPMAARVSFAVVVTVPLAVRRQEPGLVALLLTAATIGWAVHADMPEHGTVPVPSLVVATFSVACYARRALVAIVGGVLLVAAAGIMLALDFYPGSSGDPGGIAVMALVFGGAWAAGWLVHTRAAQARRAVAESGELARAAIADERTRIARELHDVVAHSVSIMAVQAGAAEELIERDPAQAREHIAHVRRTAREAMVEMRRVLDVLRTDEPRYAPQPGMARLADLIEDVRAAGVPVELVEEGQRPQLPGGLDLVVFRVVQESLTNVRKHAAGATARILLRFDPDQVELEIANSSTSTTSVNGSHAAGHGLVGMRERVQLFGGTLQAGVTSDGSFRVHAVLPISEEPA